MAATAKQTPAAAPWRDELRATLALAWPLILASLTQQVIHATDIILMGRLGEVPLAATTLAINLAFVFNVLLLGLMLASSPMMGSALGQRSNAVRDVRRTFRAGLWLLIIAMPPYWLTLWHLEPIMLAFGQSPELAEAGQRFMRAYMWCTAPWLLFQLLRNFVAALERPRLVMWLSLGAIGLNAVLGWALIFGRLGLPALGIAGGGLGSTLTWLVACAALILLVRRDRQFRRFHLFGRWWRFDGERTRAMARLGWPIGLSLALEVGVFALAAYFMGWIGTAAVAAHAIAIQFAALTFMVPVGISQAVTVRVSRALGRGRQGGDHPRRLDRLVAGHRLHGGRGALDVDLPARDRRPVPRPRREPGGGRPGGQLPRRRRRLPDRRRRAGDRHRHAARASRHALAADLLARRLLGRRAWASARGSRSAPNGRASACGSGSPAALPRSRCW